MDGNAKCKNTYAVIMDCTGYLTTLFKRPLYVFMYVCTCIGEVNMDRINRIKAMLAAKKG